MLSIQRNRFTGHGLAPYLKKFFGHFIALIVREKNAVAEGLVWIAARYDVDQQAPLRKPVECRRHSRRSGGGSDAGANRDQELELGCHRDQSRGHDPSVFTRPAGGQQHAYKPKLIGGLSHLLQIAVVDGSSLFGRAKVTTVSVSW